MSEPEIRPDAATATDIPGAPTMTVGSHLILALGGVAVLCGVLIVGAFQSTLAPIAENRRIALERSVFKLIPGQILKVYAVGSQGIKPLEAGQPVSKGEQRVYAVYDVEKKLRGLAAEAGAVGYADVVRVLYAYAPETEKIVGFGVVAHRETPGIGDKILTDAHFLKNFAALDAQLNPAGTALLHPIKTVKHGTKRNAWEIDAISGATITSRAVGRGINDGAQHLLPQLRLHLHSLETLP